MTYSASGGVGGPCGNCGSHRRRVVDGYFDQARRAPRELAEGDHAALIYDDPAIVAPFCARFVADGVSAGERVVACIRDDLREAVSELLGSEVTPAVEWQPPVSIPGDFDPEGQAADYEALITADARPARILAGPEPASGVDADDFSRFEAMAHGIIADRGATVVCVYHGSSVPARFLDVAERCHSLLVQDGGAVRRNERFEYQPA
jgi:hypothetical protein